MVYVNKYNALFAKKDSTKEPSLDDKDRILVVYIQTEEHLRDILQLSRKSS